MRNALSDTAGLQSAEQLSHLTAHVECQHPMEDLYRWLVTPSKQIYTKHIGKSLQPKAFSWCIILVHFTKYIHKDKNNVTKFRVKRQGLYSLFLGKINPSLKNSLQLLKSPWKELIKFSTTLKLYYWDESSKLWHSSFSEVKQLWNTETRYQGEPNASRKQIVYCTNHCMYTYERGQEESS